MDAPSYPIDALEELRGAAIIKLGIGGYITADQIALAFNPMSAEDFAKITYATDLMPHIFNDPEQALNIENVAAVIDQNQFETKPCFPDLIDLFRSKFDQCEVVQFR